MAWSRSTLEQQIYELQQGLRWVQEDLLRVKGAVKELTTDLVTFANLLGYAATPSPKRDTHLAFQKYEEAHE